MSAAQDRNLLFGIVALQFDFVTRDQLVAAMNAWALDTKKSLADLLVERDALTASRRAMLEPLVEEHVRQHQGDPQRSLAALNSVDDARQALEEIADPEVQASLRHLPRPSAPSGPASPQDYATIDPPATTASRFRILRRRARKHRPWLFAIGSSLITISMIAVIQSISLASTNKRLIATNEVYQKLGERSQKLTDALKEATTEDDRKRIEDKLSAVSKAFAVAPSAGTGGGDTFSPTMFGD
jgi:hypothetical protein